MLTLKQAIDQLLHNTSCRSTFSRDVARIGPYLDNKDATFVKELLKFEWKPEADFSNPKEWIKENILNSLETDLESAFEKALDRRGLSSELYYELVKFWLIILEDPLSDFEEYAQYGLPLYKHVAIKYGFNNPIGDNNGDEDHYAA